MTTDTTTFAAVLKELTTAKFGARGGRSLARATMNAPGGGGMSHTTISRLLRGEFTPGHQRITALAWALADDARSRKTVEQRLIAAAGEAAKQPSPLRWPRDVAKLSEQDRRGVQRVLNALVATRVEAAATGESEPAA